MLTKYLNSAEIIYENKVISGSSTNNSLKTNIFYQLFKIGALEVFSNYSDKELGSMYI